MGYIVVFEGTGQPGSNFAGIRTWTVFDSKEEFEAARTENAIADIIIAHGVTERQAIELTRRTTGEARAKAALAQVGENPAASTLYIANAFLAATIDGSLPEFVAVFISLDE